MIWFISLLSVGLATILVWASALDTAQTLFQVPRETGEVFRGEFWLGIVAGLGVIFWFAYLFSEWSKISDDDDWSEALPRVEQPRAYTTSRRFWLWSTLYGLFVAIAFWLIVFFPAVAAQVIDALNQIFGNISPFSGVDQIGFGGIVTAVPIILLFAKSEWEAKLRKFFQNRALIPEQARQIYKQSTHTIFDFRPPEHDLEIFLEEYKKNRKKPDYFDFEFDMNRAQESDKRMELLPRIAFMSWQMERLRTSHKGFLALQQSSSDIGKMKEQVAEFEEKARTCSTQLLSVLDGLTELETALASDRFVGSDQVDSAEELMDVRARVAADADLNVELLGEDALPVSRLDNIATALVDELDNLGARLGQHNELQAMEDRLALGRLAEAAGVSGLAENSAAFENERDPVEPEGRGRDYREVKARLDVLRAQIAAVQKSLVPVSVGRLKALDEKMQAENAELVGLANNFVGVIVCAGLAADTSPSKEFFNAFGLNPKLGNVRFRLERATVLVAAPLLAFLAFLIAQAILSNSSDFSFGIWLLFGTLFIAGSIVYGCIHGAALASSALEKASDDAIPLSNNFTFFHGLSTFVFSSSFLIIGVYGLCILLAFENAETNSGQEALNAFRGSWPFATVAAVWSVFCAYITVRASLSDDPVIVRRDWFVFPALALLFIGVCYAIHKDTMATLAGPWWWAMISALAVSLTIALMGGAKWSVTKVDA